MTKDFSQYHKIIDRFKGRVNQSEFEANFLDATKHIAKTDRFLLKMEVKRLANPCTRLIDLRGHVDGECKAYVDDSRTHYLDDIAIKVYVDNKQAYGSYTFGVYEAVNNTENNFRVIYQREKTGVIAPATSTDAPKILEKLQYPAKFYQFGRYFNRKEERMNFAVALHVTLSNGNEVEATSSDMSVSGCKFKFVEPQQVAIGDKIEVVFTGLEQEFQFGKVNRFDYQVCNIHHEENIQQIGVKRLLDKEKDGFKQFLSGFIQGNKRRYKINLDNTIAAIQARSFEQFSLPKSNELPIFVEAKDGDLLPRYALTSNNNQASYQYWQDEAKHSALHCLVNADRIERLKAARKLGRNLVVYSFIHQSHGKAYFYTADEKQLAADKGFMSQFIGFAASKPSFAVTELSLLDIEPSYAFSPYTVANTLPKKDAYLNLPMSEEVEAIVTQMANIVIAFNITSEKVRQDYMMLDYENIDTNRLKALGHKRLKTPNTVDELGINYRNHRQEARFKYKTPVVAMAEGVTWSGVSQDFSISGLKYI